MAISQGEYRALVIGSAPNWSQKLTTKVYWKTVIAESLAGYEHRMACYARPLIKTSYKVTNITRELSSYLRMLIESRSETPVAIPIWMDSCMLLADAVAGQTALSVSAQNRLFPWFKYALLYSSDEDYEVVRITSIGSDFVLLSSEIERDHAVKSILCPLAFGNIKLPNSSYLTATLSEFTIDFEEKLGWIGTETSAGVILTGGGAQQSDSVAQDWENFTYPPNWISSQKQGAIEDLEFKALDRGRATPIMFSTEKRRTFDFVYLADRYHLQSVLQFFEHHKGRRGSYYIPSWTEDFIVTQKIEQGDIAIPLERTGLSEMPENYGSVFLFASPTEENRLIGRVRRQHCKDVFLPDEPFPEDEIPPGTALSAAVKVRLIDDEIEIKSSSPDGHEFTLSFIECPHETDADEEDADKFQALITNPTEIWIYKIHRSDKSRVFADWPYQINVSGIPDCARAQAANIKHTGCELTEDSLASEMEIQATGDVWDFIAEDMQSPIDVTVYKGLLIENTGDCSATEFFTGRAESISSNDRKVTFTLSSGLRELRREGTNIMVQRKCCRLFGTPLCGVNKLEFRVAAQGALQFQNLTEGVYTIKGITFDIANTKPESYWIGAKILLTVDSAKSQCPPHYTGIITNIYTDEQEGLCMRFTGAADDRYQEYGETFPGAVNAFDRFYLYPVCQRTIGSCKMFDNQPNFLGFPWLPNNNPLDALEIGYDARGKK